MKRKSIFIMLGIILVATLVSAQIVFDLTNAEFTPESKGEIILYEGSITFDCRGSPMVVYVSSGDEKIDDDFEQVVSSVCTSLVTNVIDWNGRPYKQNEFGLRSFDEDKTIMQRRIGEMVFVIGRPRVFNEKKYIVPEIIKKVENKKWAEYRQLELGKMILSNNKSEIIDPPSNESSGPDITDSILQKITELDNGYGVKTDEVIKAYNKKTANLTIIKLLETGEIFEIKPGILKSI